MSKRKGNIEQTSKRVASEAGAILRDSRSSAREKSVAASALTQYSKARKK